MGACFNVCAHRVHTKKHRPCDKGLCFSGGLEGIRTLDPHNANVVRSQLRYKPIQPLYYNAALPKCQEKIGAVSCPKGNHMVNWMTQKAA